MTLDEAVLAVEATVDPAYHRVDRRRAREEGTSFLLVVLDISGGRRDDGEPIANGPRLVDKSSGAVSRLLLPDAVARAEHMAPVRS